MKPPHLPIRSENPDGNFEIDADGRIRDVDANACTMLGVAAGALIVTEAGGPLPVDAGDPMVVSEPERTFVPFAPSAPNGTLDAPRNDLRGTSLGDWLVHHETRMRTVLQRVGRHLSQTPAPARSTGAWSTLEVRSARGRGRRCIIHLAARDDGLLELSLAPMP